MIPMLRYAFYSTCNGSWLKTACFKIQMLSTKTDDTIFCDAAIQRMSHGILEAVAF